MANDRVYHVDHPEVALMAPNGWAVTVVDPSGVFSVLALNLMAPIEYQSTGSIPKKWRLPSGPDRMACALLAPQHS
jgi:hypothetical protein